MTNVAIIDHGAGNLVSVTNALTAIGAAPRVITSPAGLATADAVVLPGVGATGAAMDRLNETGMADAVTAWEGPLLGICVGLQLLFDRSDEDAQPCLGLMAGTVRQVTGQPLPHMGWNDVNHRRDPLFDGIPSGEPFYFVHSYAPAPLDEDQTIATAHHGSPFTAAVRSRNRVGVQFHPERSGAAGFRLLSNFVANVTEPSRVA
ncbi:MAG: imidazole glycerol phosphate synthase subunit HisH [Actinomycetia bacterium]|nr:imidazole glycerol phosphate synthase subunit HisH [Actinomycetes bacterium]